MTLQIHDADELPPLVRGGSQKNAEENRQIGELLNDRKPHYIENVVPGSKDFTALSQRIRTIAKKMGISVKIRSDVTDNRIFFQGVDQTEAPESPLKTKTSK